MAESHRFRSAIGGFNRQDVVQYIEYLNAKHTAQVNQLTSEVEFLRQQLERQQGDPAERIAQLEEKCAALEQERDAALADQSTQNVTDAELEAYRRAERTERNAKERAEQIYRQATGTLADATARIDDAAVQLGTTADSVKQQLSLLQSAIENSKASLQDATAIMATIRPEDSEN